jgi:ATP-dependent RNA helicase RhlE
LQSFATLELIDPLLRAVSELGYGEPTPIQVQAIPPLLAGRDVLGCAQTGTGKTAAFALPILQHLTTQRRTTVQRKVRALVLSPTRELAAQIAESFDTYGRNLELRTTVVFGGVSARPQADALSGGVDILVATPGRLLDLARQGLVDLRHVAHFVLDEADRMLDLGFVDDIQRVLELLPPRRQNLLFSATMPLAIGDLASSFLRDPVRVAVTPRATTVELVDQRVMYVERGNKRRLLTDLVNRGEVAQAIVFTRTRHGANRLVEQLERAGIRAAALHSDKSQGARESALDGFKSGDFPLLVATDIAARGIDVEGVSHVFNYDIPNEPENYVHRIGRTGRAGRGGVAVAFCDPSEGELLRGIEALTGRKLTVVTDHPWHCGAAIPPPTLNARKQPAPPPRPRDYGPRKGKGAARRRR